MGCASRLGTAHQPSGRVGPTRRRGSATAAVVVVGSGEPATAKLVTPSASSSVPSWGEEDGDVEEQPPRCGRRRQIWRARRRQARHAVGELVRRQARHAVGEIVRAVVGEEDGGVDLTAAPHHRQIHRCRHRCSPPSLDPLPPELGWHRSAAGGRGKREGGEGRGEAGEVRGEEKRTERRCRWRRNRREREGGIKKRGGWEETDSGSQVV
uniref:Uncharacterized protein n=1 Tax=Oryza sativa subsp. indica TaxID=39946 RepID=A0MLV6_ORYSI|nr:hypothetical protein [Oryza sativa Indica Group]